MELDTWLTFVAVWTIAGLPLGPNAVHTINVTIRHGYPKCLAAPIGMAVACVLHAGLTAFGLGALLLLFPGALLALKLFGACYLAWLGVQLWRRTASHVVTVSKDSTSFLRLIASACTVSLVNPKALLAYLAIFSPFVSADVALAPQLSILIPTAAVLVFLNYLGYSSLAWPLRRWMTSPSKRRLFDRLSGSMFIGFAAALAYSATRSQR